MSNIPGSNFVVHATKPDGTSMDFGPFQNSSAAISFAEDAQASGYIVNWTMTYTDTHGNTVQYEQA